MPKPFPREFREDVVRVARHREAGVTLEQIAADFEIHPMTLSKWLRVADVEDGPRSGTGFGAGAGQLAELREAKKRIWTLEGAVASRRTIQGRARQRTRSDRSCELGEGARDAEMG